ncbi:glycosyltransferase family 2 protein [Paenibacillus naphthalenovorans]|uniref:glycosyltransferase family 2 protein n=1 Tax=Paenibacillus naphthalenovorans TaxID=162209 RepID=UPI003D2D4999
MTTLVSVIIPVWNGAERLPATLKAVDRVISTIEGAKPRALKFQLIVVDDGSVDDTRAAAYPWADLVIGFPVNRGKAAAMSAGCRAAGGEIFVFLDADLGETAACFPVLLEPLVQNQADLTVARLPQVNKPAGFGLVKGLASRGVKALSGYSSLAPLSGQRAVRAEVWKRCGRVYTGFGVEVGMLIDTVKLGYRVMELAVPFGHRETGRDWGGFVHRGKQFVAVGLALWECWRKPVC